MEKEMSIVQWCVLCLMMSVFESCSMVRLRTFSCHPMFWNLFPLLIPMYCFKYCSAPHPMLIPDEPHALCQCFILFGTFSQACGVSLANVSRSNWDGRAFRKSRRWKKEVAHTLSAERQSPVEALRMVCSVWQFQKRLIWWKIWRNSFYFDSLTSICTLILFSFPVTFLFFNNP